MTSTRKNRQIQAHRDRGDPCRKVTFAFAGALATSAEYWSIAAQRHKLSYRGKHNILFGRRV